MFQAPISGLAQAQQALHPTILTGGWLLESSSSVSSPVMCQSRTNLIEPTGDYTVFLQDANASDGNQAHDIRRIAISNPP